MNLLLKGLGARSVGKNNILVQNVLTNAVFGAVPVVGRLRSDAEICLDLNDGQRGMDFKKLSVDRDVFIELSSLSIGPESLTNKV